MRRRAPRRPRETGAAAGGAAARRRRSRSASVEGALELVEEALVGLVRPLVRLRVEVLQQAPLLLAQMPGHHDVHEHALVAAAEALEHGHALAAEHDDGARLGAG